MLPQAHALIALFGAEPELSDPDMPWQYNTLTFRVRRGDEALEVEIWPSGRSMAVAWSRGDVLAAQLDLHEIERLSVERDRPGDEVLVATFAAKLTVVPFRLRLSPHISILWGVDPWPET